MRQQNTLVGVALFIGVGLICGLFTALCSASTGEIAAALGSVVGGIIGALGAAAAVYLTLKVQRDDETEKVCTAIITEIAQLSRFPLEQLAFCRAIMEGRRDIPRLHLRTVMQTPPPALYLSAAESISRVPRPTLVIAFYIGLFETEKCVNVINTTPSYDIFLTPLDVRGLGVLLINQCYHARQILAEAPIPSGRERELVTAMLSEFVQRLDAELARSRAVFPDTQDFERSTEI
jgi:hypothetical protein